MSPEKNRPRPRGRLSRTAEDLLLFLGEDLYTPRYGLEISEALDITNGTLYPTLKDLQARGLVTSTKERIDPERVGRPARTYFRLTAAGEVFTARIVEQRIARMTGPATVSYERALEDIARREIVAVRYAGDRYFLNC